MTKIYIVMAGYEGSKDEPVAAFWRKEDADKLWDLVRAMDPRKEIRIVEAPIEPVKMS